MAARKLYKRFVDLIDRFTVDLPTINGPLSSALGSLGNQVSKYLVKDGIKTLSITTGEITPDANDGHSQKLELTVDSPTLNLPTNLGEGKSMLITLKQGLTGRGLDVDASYKFMGAGVAADIATLATGEYAWLSISRHEDDYLISITTEA